MALKSTIHKAELSISDIGRGHYHDYALTIARHPSETEERMMVRLLAFALHADEALEFGKGLSTEDEPDLWHRDLTGRILTWIDVGLPDPRRLRKACGRADQVVVLPYGGRAADLWWQQNERDLAKLDSLLVIALPVASTQALAALARRTMRLTATLQDGQVWLTDETGASATVELQELKRAGA